MNATRLFIALFISFCTLHSAFCIASPSDRGDRFTDEALGRYDLLAFGSRANGRP